MGFHMYVPTRFIFGRGRLNELGEQKLPGKKALLLISNGKSAKKSGALKRAEDQLKRAGIQYVLFAGINANPTKTAIMDAAKAIAMMATNNGDLWDYVGGKTGKSLPLNNDPLPIVCITTTAGTGSEADQWGVVTNEETNEKIGAGGYDSLFPVLSVIDPELMVSVPPKFTAYQGFDVLFHATESYISSFASLMSDMYALTAIENVGKYLARAVKDGRDMEARERLATGGCLPKKLKLIIIKGR